LASWFIQPFGHDRYEPKIGASAPFGEWELGPHLRQSRLGWCLPPCQVASWSIQPFGHNRYGPKIGGSATFWGRGSLVPIQHNVARAEAYLYAKFHLDPSNHLATIHQRHRQTDSQDIQRSDSIGRTILQTVTQKLLPTILKSSFLGTRQYERAFRDEASYIKHVSSSTDTTLTANRT